MREVIIRKQINMENTEIPSLATKSGEKKGKYRVVTNYRTRHAYNV